MSVTERFNLKVGDFQLLESPVEKHGTHDQKTHGNWATGVSSDVASTIQQFTREWGGLSISMVDGSMPTTGYMVAKPSSFGKVVDEADFFDPVKGPKILSQYMREQRADLATGKNYLGTWLNGGKIFLDVSENITDVGEATRLGRERDQIAIWDVANQVEVDTGGTGGVEKESRNGGVEELSQYDGRGNRRLRVGDLEKVRRESGQVQVIRFEYGLKPILKHEGGGHDQSSHGNWSKYREQGYSEEQSRRIAEVAGLGPTLDDMNNAISGGQDNSDESIGIYVMNDRYQYDTMREEMGVEGHVRRDEANFEYENNRKPNEQEKANIYEEIENGALEGYIERNRSELNQLINEEQGTVSDVRELEGSFREIFDMSVETDFGTMDSKVSSVFQNEENTINVEGNITINGTNIGNFQREFIKNDDDTWSVEHKWLTVDDDYQGLGFGGQFFNRSQDYYASIGVRDITLLAGLEDGARHWARTGFDWDGSMVQDSFQKLTRRVENDDNLGLTAQDKTDFQNVWSRGAESVLLAEGYPRGIKMKDLKSNDFPFPAEFANIGWDRRTIGADGQHDWAGKRIMSGMALSYRKPITAEGRNLLSGPIDADGDGLIYDGTDRERPAPSNN
jgi:GNAT superfamily N-acetyltransferase